jgi:hypothetical protein
MEFFEYEKENSRKKGSFSIERKSNLFEVAEDIFEKKEFKEGDIVLIDNDETIHNTIQNILYGLDPLENLPEDSKIFLEMCEEKNIQKAIVTNMPRTEHYMNHEIPVFGYDHYYEKGILKNIEFPLTLCLGSLYKQTERSIYEIANWVINNREEEGRVAWIGNSPLDKGFGLRLDKVLREEHFDSDFYMYRLPWIRSFGSDILKYEKI